MIFLEVVYLGFRDEKRMKNRIKLLIIRFKNELRTSEIKFFRGAVFGRVCGTPHDVLFSDHTEDGLRYSLFPHKIVCF